MKNRLLDHPFAHIMNSPDSLFLRAVIDFGTGPAVLILIRHNLRGFRLLDSPSFWHETNCDGVSRILRRYLSSAVVLFIVITGHGSSG